MPKTKSQAHRIKEQNVVFFFLGQEGKLLINGHKVSGKQDTYVWEICSTTLYLK